MYIPLRIACLFTYACACRHAVARPRGSAYRTRIERSAWLDIFPFQLKFTTGWIFSPVVRHFLSSEPRYVLQRVPRGRANDYTGTRVK